MSAERSPSVSALTIQLAAEIIDPSGQTTANPEFRDPLNNFIEVEYGSAASPASPERRLGIVASDFVTSGFDEARLLRLAGGDRAHPAVREGAMFATWFSAVQAGLVLREVDTIFPNLAGNKDLRSIAAADWLAYQIHSEQPRENGGTHYDHTKQVMVMAWHVFNQMEADGFIIDPRFRTAVLCGLSLHDAEEDAERPRNLYEAKPDLTTIIFSPALARSILEVNGNPYSQSVATGLRLATRFSQLDWDPGYARYTSNLSADFMASVLKLFDQNHNRNIDPKHRTPENVGRVALKDGLYDARLGEFRRLAPTRTDDPRLQYWAAHVSSYLFKIKPGEVRGLVEAFDRTVYGSLLDLDQVDTDLHYLAAA